MNETLSNRKWNRIGFLLVKTHPFVLCSFILEDGWNLGGDGVRYMGPRVYACNVASLSLLFLYIFVLI